jgi:PEP-CTERM motif
VAFPLQQGVTGVTTSPYSCAQDQESTTMNIRQIAIASTLTLAATLAQAYTTTVINDDTREFGDITLSQTSPAEIDFQILGTNPATFTLTTGAGGEISSFDLYYDNDMSAPLAFSSHLKETPSKWVVTFNSLDAAGYIAYITGSGTASMRVAMGPLDTSPVPEPESLALALAGVAVAGTLLRRRQAA